jgi:ATP-dependent RNA helicase DDX18/HAS1
VSLNLESKRANVRKLGNPENKKGADYRRLKTGHAFSASNPYGKRAEGDKRQFVRM